MKVIVCVCVCMCAAFRALLQIKAMQPLDPDAKLDDDVVTGNPKVRGKNREKYEHRFNHPPELAGY